MLRRAFVTFGLVCVASVARAQADDPVFARARQLVQNGNGAAGRLLIDSVITATASESPTYGEALYWRAALSPTSGDAERDYRRFVIEYPFSAHVSDALLKLADLESAHGDRAAATAHLDQFLRDNPKSTDRPRAVLMYARLLLEQNDLPRGCTALKQTLSELPESSVELRNQLEYYLPRCAANDVSRGGAVPIGAAADTAREAPKGAASKPTAPAAKTAKTPAAKYTLQVAAYKTKGEADAVVRGLVKKKLDARVVAVKDLFRVRVGRYATRAAAVAAQKELKAKKIDSFVTDIEPDSP